MGDKPDPELKTHAAGTLTQSGGVFAPGTVDYPGGTRTVNDIGETTIEGTYTQTGTAVLEIDIAGFVSYDEVLVNAVGGSGGDATIVGIDVGLGGYTPNIGDTFDVLTADGTLDYTGLTITGDTAGGSWNATTGLPGVLQLQFLPATISDAIWEGGPGDWSNNQWTVDTNTNRPPPTFARMVVDDAGGTSNVTVVNNFNAAVSLKIGETNTSTVAVASGKTLTVVGPTTVGASGTLDVDGTFDAAGVDSSGAIDVSGALNANTVGSSGTLDVSGTLDAPIVDSSGTLNLSGTGTIDADTLNSSGTLAVSGTATIDADTLNSSGTLAVTGTLDAATLNSSGDTDFVSGSLGTIPTLNVTAGTADFAASSGPGITTLNATGGATIFESGSGATVATVNVSGGSVTMSGPTVDTVNVDNAASILNLNTAATNLNVTDGTVNVTGTGAAVTNAAITGGTVNTQGNALTVNAAGNAKLNLLTISNPTDSFTLAGANLGDDGTARTVTVSGGTTTIGGLQGYLFINDHFDDGDIATGGPNATNGGFDIYNSRIGGDATISESGTLATLAWTTGNKFRKMGINSKTRADVVNQAAIEVTFAVDSLTLPTLTDADLDSMKFGLADLIFTMKTTNATNLTYSIGLHETGDRHNYSHKLVGDINISSIRSEFEDGFSVVMEADRSSWSISFPGTTLDTQSGPWPDGYTYNSVFDDTTIRPNEASPDEDAARDGDPDATAWVQAMRRGGDPYSLNLDSIRVNSVVPDLMGVNTNIAVTANSTLDVDPNAGTAALGDLTVADGVTALNLATAVYVFNDANIAGGVTVDGELTISGTLDVGNNVGAVTVAPGAILELDGGTFNAEVGLSDLTAPLNADKIVNNDGGIIVDTGSLALTGVGRTGSDQFAARQTVTIIDNAKGIFTHPFLNDPAGYIGEGAFLRGGVTYDPAFGTPTATIDVVVALEGDVDGDGLIGLDDWDTFRANFGSTGTDWTEGNFDPWSDSTVDLDDWDRFRSRFGQTYPIDGPGAAAAAVPEPGTIVMLLSALAGLAVLGRRRRAA